MSCKTIETSKKKDKADIRKQRHQLKIFPSNDFGLKDDKNISGDANDENDGNDMVIKMSEKSMVTNNHIFDDYY
ncbi:hypothetical protein CEXT_346161 [Caerostris extrusa]|uniref:Uncharacterized protein n=1 Tax=Caerostris extrusa TaxID=172846 RepID=A0AAV4WCK7_CAEEX|nr:hypothetical protein CEXT_346161 [Caerostris extrusa]